MGKEYNSQIQQRLEAYIIEAGSQSKAAQAIGYSPAVLSTYRKGDYKGNIEEVESKLSGFFRLLDEKQAASQKAEPYSPVQDKYVSTFISSDVYQSIRYCQISKGIAVLHGDAGIGKTKAAEQYVHDNPGTAIYLQVSPLTGNLSSFLKMLSRALRIPEGHSKLDMLFNIREKLDGTDKVLIIDEAQHLKLSALEEIRTWSEPNAIMRSQGIGIVLIGNTEVYNRMRGRQQANFAQLFSRIRMNRCYSTRQVRRDDVDMLFPLLNEKQMKKELDFIYGICQSRWGIRGGVNVYNNAVNNENITYDGLALVARKMGIGVV